MEAAESIGVRSEEWVLAHEALCRLRLKRAELAVEEGSWLLRAFRASTHAHFGFASFWEYIEQLLGLGRRATEEKLRVAGVLEELPALAEALHSGELTWSAVRELTRVVVPETEREWLAVALGKTAREVERWVSGLAPGDRPNARRRPELVRHVLRFEVGAETLAIFREALRMLQKQSDHRLNDDEALLTMAREILGGPGDAGRASYQIVVTRCEDCGRGFQQANGELIALDAGIVEMCHCDAQHVTIPQARETVSRAATAEQGDAPGERRNHAHVDAVGGLDRNHAHVDAVGGLQSKPRPRGRGRPERSKPHPRGRRPSEEFRARQGTAPAIVARCSCATGGAVSFQVVETPITWTFTIWICARRAVAMIRTIWWCCAGHITARCTAVACTSTARSRRGSASATPMGPPTGSCRRQCWRRPVRRRSLGSETLASRNDRSRCASSCSGGRSGECHGGDTPALGCRSSERRQKLEQHERELTKRPADGGGPGVGIGGAGGPLPGSSPPSLPKASRAERRARSSEASKTSAGHFFLAGVLRARARTPFRCRWRASTIPGVGRPPLAELLTAGGPRKKMFTILRL